MTSNDNKSICPIGICLPIEGLSSSIINNVDFIELCATDALHLASQYNLNLNLPPILAIRCLLPEDLLISSLPDNKKQFEDYLDKTTKAFNTLGVKYLVLGSGISRNIPKNHDIEIFYKKWEMFASISKKYWMSNDLELLLEPLVPVETNFINTITDTEQWLSLFSGIVADIEHIGKDSMFPIFVKKEPNLIRHVHLSGMYRKCPTKEDWTRIESFLSTILDTGARPSISLEVSWKELAPNATYCIMKIRSIIKKLI